MTKQDLKVKVDKKSFTLIQDMFLKNGIRWDNSGFVYRHFFDDIKFLYYRYKSNTFQYGIHEYNYDADIALEVSVDEFIRLSL